MVANEFRNKLKEVKVKNNHLQKKLKQIHKKKTNHKTKNIKLINAGLEEHLKGFKKTIHQTLYF